MAINMAESIDYDGSVHNTVAEEAFRAKIEESPAKNVLAQYLDSGLSKRKLSGQNSP